MDITKPFYLPVQVVYGDDDSVWIEVPDHPDVLKPCTYSYAHPGNPYSKDVKYIMYAYGYRQKIRLKPVRTVTRPHPDAAYKYESVLIAKCPEHLAFEIYLDRMPEDMRAKLQKA